MGLDHVITPANHSPTTAAKPGPSVRRDSGIESRPYRVRDVGFDEDRNQVRAGNTPR